MTTVAYQQTKKCYDLPVKSEHTVKTPEILPPEGKRAPEDLVRLATLLDNAIPIPGTNLKVGLDAVIGLIPGLGDTVSALLSSYIIFRAAQLGLPVRALLLMSWNVVLDTVFGAIPLAGDLFDFAYKSNIKNIGVIERYGGLEGKTLDHARSAKHSMRLLTAIGLGLMVAITAGTAMLVTLLLRLIFG